MRVAKTYSEIIWSVKSGFEEKNEAKRRLGKKNSDETIIKELSMETGLSPERIRKSLVQCEYLTEVCLLELTQRRVGEDFYEAAQPVKRLLVKNLIDRGLDHEQIEEAISSALPAMWQEYRQTGRIDKRRWMKVRSPTSEQEQGWVSGEEAIGKSQLLKYRPPNGRGPVPRPLKTKQISSRLQNLSKDISEIAQGTEEKRCDLIQEVGRLLTKMIGLHHTLLHGRESTKGETDNEPLH
jgi:hypothetical protein